MRIAGRLRSVYAAGVVTVVLAVLLVGLWWSVRRTREGVRPTDGTGGVVADVGIVETLPATPPAGLPPQEKIVESAEEGLEYVWIPPGVFRMGCVPGDEECDEDEMPRHPVRIGRGFWMGVTEVPVAAFRRFTGATGRELPEPPPFNPDWGLDDHPMVNVTLQDSGAYCTWAGGRLPTEAEWEYAARGGVDGATFPWGDACGTGNANRRGVSSGDRWEQTSPVGSFPANRFGLFDMAGNASEWVQDEWHAGYEGAPADGSGWGTAGVTGPGQESAVLRGGSWLYDCRQLRTSYRARWFWPGNRLDDYGFRCVRDTAP